MIKILAAAILVLLTVFLVIIFGTLFGGIAGWCVGWAFPEVISALKDFMGVEVTNFQLGAALGFVGGFFRSTTMAGS